MSDVKKDPIGKATRQGEFKHHNPLLPGDGARFIDSKIAARQTSKALREVMQVEAGARGRVELLQEKARRAKNRAELIERIALGEFVADLEYATCVYELLANHHFDLLGFNMDTLFPGEGGETMREYLSSFRAIREESKFLSPMPFEVRKKPSDSGRIKISFPMALGVWGNPRELDDYDCNRWQAGLDELRRSEARTHLINH